MVHQPLQSHLITIQPKTYEIKVDLHTRKNKILTDLYTSNAIQDKVTNLLIRHKYPLGMDIQSDIVQETFLHMSKIPAETIIEMFEDNPARLIGLATTIMVRKGVLKNKETQSPKHSIANWIMYGSSCGEIQREEDEHPIDLLENMTNDDFEDDSPMWEFIYKNLNEEETKTLDQLLERIKQKKRIGVKRKTTKYYRLKLKLKLLITVYQKQKEND